MQSTTDQDTCAFQAPKVCPSHSSEPTSMSGRDINEPKAKRRRCAPKRYAEEDDALPADDSAGKASPESSNEQKQQHQRQDAARADPSLWRCSPTQMQPFESEDDQALRIIQQLAVKLENDGRPCLRDLFCQTDRHSTLSRLVLVALHVAELSAHPNFHQTVSITSSLCMCRPGQLPSMTKDVTEAAALLVSFGC